MDAPSSSPGTAVEVDVSLADGQVTKLMEADASHSVACCILDGYTTEGKLAACERRGTFFKPLCEMAGVHQLSRRRYEEAPRSNGRPLLWVCDSHFNVDNRTLHPEKKTGATAPKVRDLRCTACGRPFLIYSRGALHCDAHRRLWLLPCIVGMHCESLSESTSSQDSFCVGCAQAAGVQLFYNRGAGGSVAQRRCAHKSHAPAWDAVAEPVLLALSQFLTELARVEGFSANMMILKAMHIVSPLLVIDAQQAPTASQRESLALSAKHLARVPAVAGQVARAMLDLHFGGALVDNLRSADVALAIHCMRTRVMLASTAPQEEHQDFFRLGASLAGAVVEELQDDDVRRRLCSVPTDAASVTTLTMLPPSLAAFGKGVMTRATTKTARRKSPFALLLIGSIIIHLLLPNVQPWLLLLLQRLVGKPSLSAKLWQLLWQCCALIITQRTQRARELANYVQRTKHASQSEKQAIGREVLTFILDNWDMQKGFGRYSQYGTSASGVHVTHRVVASQCLPAAMSSSSLASQAPTAPSQSAESVSAGMRMEHNDAAEEQEEEEEEEEEEEGEGEEDMTGEQQDEEEDTDVLEEEGASDGEEEDESNKDNNEEEDGLQNQKGALDNVPRAPAAATMIGLEPLRRHLDTLLQAMWSYDGSSNEALLLHLAKAFTLPRECAPAVVPSLNVLPPFLQPPVKDEDVLAAVQEMYDEYVLPVGEKIVVVADMAIYLRLLRLSEKLPLMLPMTGQWHVNAEMLRVVGKFLSEHGLAMLVSPLGITDIQPLVTLKNWKAGWNTYIPVFVALMRSLKEVFPAAASWADLEAAAEPAAVVVQYVLTVTTALSIALLHRTSVRCGNGPLMLACMQAFAPLCPVTGANNYAVGLAHNIAALLTDDYFRGRIFASPSFCLREDAHEQEKECDSTPTWTRPSNASAADAPDPKRVAREGAKRTSTKALEGDRPEWHRLAPDELLETTVGETKRNHTGHITPQRVAATIALYNEQRDFVESSFKVLGRLSNTSGSNQRQQLMYPTAMSSLQRELVDMLRSNTITGSFTAEAFLVATEKGEHGTPLQRFVTSYERGIEREKNIIEAHVLKSGKVADVSKGSRKKEIAEVRQARKQNDKGAAHDALRRSKKAELDLLRDLERAIPENDEAAQQRLERRRLAFLQHGEYCATTTTPSGAGKSGNKSTLFKLLDNELSGAAAPPDAPPASTAKVQYAAVDMMVRLGKYCRAVFSSPRAFARALVLDVVRHTPPSVILALCWDKRQFVPPVKVFTQAARSGGVGLGPAGPSPQLAEGKKVEIARFWRHRDLQAKLINHILPLITDELRREYAPRYDTLVVDAGDWRDDDSRFTRVEYGAAPDVPLENAVGEGELAIAHLAVLLQRASAPAEIELNYSYYFVSDDTDCFVALLAMSRTRMDEDGNLRGRWWLLANRKLIDVNEVVLRLVSFLPGWSPLVRLGTVVVLMVLGGNDYKERLLRSALVVSKRAIHLYRRYPAQLRPLVAPQLDASGRFVIDRAAVHQLVLAMFALEHRLLHTIAMPPATDDAAHNALRFAIAVRRLGMKGDPEESTLPSPRATERLIDRTVKVVQYVCSPNDPPAWYEGERSGFAEKSGIPHIVWDVSASGDMVLGPKANVMLQKKK